jgi:hypothetical protein
MMKTDNEESNSLIAAFMGFDKIADDKWVAHYVTGLLDPYFGQFRAVHFRFDSSWEWLMPVVDKIEIYASFTISSCSAWIALGNHQEIVSVDGISNLDATYKAVVEFIKWYNSQNPSR